MKKKILDLIPYLATVLLITGIWFLKSGYLFFVDVSWGPQFLETSWKTSSFILEFIINGLFLFLPHPLVEKVFISFVLFIVLLGGRKIVSNFIKDESEKSFSPESVLIFVLSLFALFNPFVYDRSMYGQFYFVLSFGFFLLAAGYLWEFLEKNSTKSIVYGGLFIGLAILFAPSFIIFSAVVLIFFGAIAAWERFFGEKKKREKLFLNSIILLAIIVFLNLNWLSGIFLDKTEAGYTSLKITTEDLSAFKTSGETSLGVAKNVFLMSGFWGKDQFRYADLTQIKSNWGRSFVLLLPFILWGLVYCLRDKRKKRLAIGLLILFFSSFVLAAGASLPISKNITSYLFDHFSFYRGLRETQKWVALMVFVYLVFLSLGVRELFGKRIIQKNYFLVTLIFLILIIMQAPLFIWGFGGQVKPADYPRDWYEADNFIKEKGCSGSILFLPWHMYMSFEFTGGVVLNPAKTFFSCPTIRGTNMEFKNIYDNSGSGEGGLIGQWLGDRGQIEVLNKINIQYIVLVKEIDWQKYYWVDGLDYLEKIKEMDGLLIYKNKFYETK